MTKSLRLTLLLLVFALVLTGCFENFGNLIAPEDGGVTIEVDLAKAKSDGHAVERVHVTLTRGQAIRDGNLSISAAGNKAMGTFNKLAAGEWHVQVKAYDRSDNLIGEGSSRTQVVAKQTGQTTVVLSWISASEDDPPGEQPPTEEPPGGPPSGTEPPSVSPPNNEDWDSIEVTELVSYTVASSSALWPLDVGNTWEYLGHFHVNGESRSMTMTMSVTGLETVNGVQVSVLRQAGVDGYQGFTLMSSDHNAAYQYGWWNDEEDEWELFEEPSPLWDISTYDDEYCAVYEDAVTVPAGTFTDVVAIDCSQEYNDFVSSETEWIKPGVGPIKTVYMFWSEDSDY